MLEQRMRKGTGTEHWSEVNTCHCKSQEETTHCCPNHASADSFRRNTLSTYCFKKHSDDRLGQLLQQMTTKKYFIQDHLTPVFEEAAKLYDAVCTKREAELRSSVETTDSDSPPAALFQSSQDKAGLQAACITGAIQRRLMQKIREDTSRSERLTVQDGGRLAYPQSYKMMFPKSPYINLDAVPAESMVALMDKGWTVIRNWINPQQRVRSSAAGVDPVAVSKAIADDTEWLDMHGLFESQAPFGPNPHRTDKAMWINAGDVPDNLYGLLALSQLLTSLPFEMNNKTQAKLSVSGSLGATVPDQ